MKKIKFILALQLLYSAIFSQRMVDTSFANYSNINNQYQFKLPVAFTDFKNNTAIY